MTCRLRLVLVALLLASGCGFGGPSSEDRYQSARAALAEAASAQVQVRLALRVLPRAGESVGPVTNVTFEGWVSGQRASGLSRIKDLTTRVLRDEGLLYTYVTREYLASAVGRGANQRLVNRWLVSRVGLTGALSGAMTVPELLRLMPAGAEPEDLGAVFLEGREVTRLRYKTEGGTTVTLWVSRTSKPEPVQLVADNREAQSQVTVRFARLGQAPSIALPRDVADPFGVLG